VKSMRRGRTKRNTLKCWEEESLDLCTLLPRFSRPSQARSLKERKKSGQEQYLWGAAEANSLYKIRKSKAVRGETDAGVEADAEMQATGNEEYRD